MNAAQQRVFDMVVEDRKNVFLTGQGGVGKTYVIKKITAALRKEKRKYAVTAATGAAALLIRGSTLHSWAGIGHGKDDVKTLYAKISTTKKSLSKWNNTKIVYNDYISVVWHVW